MWFITTQHSEETTWSSLHYSLCIVTPQGNCQHGDREQGGKIKKKKKERQIPKLAKGTASFLTIQVSITGSKPPPPPPRDDHSHST